MASQRSLIAWNIAVEMEIHAALSTQTVTKAQEIDKALQPVWAAFEALLNRYVQLAESGDCGFWNPEEEPEVIAARAALAMRGA